MWSTIFSSFSHLCEMTDVLAGLMLVVGVDMMAATVITLGSMVGVAYIVGVLAVLISDSVTAIDVDILADENVNGLAAVMTPLEFNLSSP